MKGIPVLMYHHVNPVESSNMVTPKFFDEHMRFLRYHGYTTIDTQEMIALLRDKRPIPPKTVLITFDDGWLDNWSFAFPILKKYSLKSVIFVITSLIAEKGKRELADNKTATALPTHKECLKEIKEGNASKVMLSWGELREMENSGLIDIQSHTHTHKRWDKLYKNKQVRLETLYQDLKTSKEIIEKRLDKQCTALCWPRGIYNKDYIDIAKSIGYELLFTTEKGTNTHATEPSRIKRFVVGNISSLTLRKKLFIHSSDWLSRAYLKIFK